MTENKETEELLRSARDYAALGLEHLVECVHVDEDDLERLRIDLQTIFLYPTLSNPERLTLCRPRYLGHWLCEARGAKPFGLSAQRNKRFQNNVRRLTAE